MRCVIWPHFEVFLPLVPVIFYNDNRIMGSTELKILQLGRKVRLLREEKAYTLDQFSKKVGLSVPLLIQIEQEEVMPPIATLINMAVRSGKDLSYFFEEPNPDVPYTVVRKGKEKTVSRQLPQGKNPLSYSYSMLAAQKMHKKMEPLMVVFSPTKEKIPQVAHDGEEFLYLISGKLEFKLDEKKITLNVGDSLYFESKRAHAFKALGGKKAKALVVLYPH